MTDEGREYGMKYNSISQQKRISAIITLVLVIFLLAFVGFPLLWMMISSFKPGVELFTIPPEIMPKKWSLEWYQQAFANENYENVVYINFKDNESAKRIFDRDFVVDRMTIDISALIPGVHFVPGKTVIIFDEVQECANARASIKSFMLDGRFDIICTGSLLGIKGFNRKKN